MFVRCLQLVLFVTCFSAASVQPLRQPNRSDDPLMPAVGKFGQCNKERTLESETVGCLFGAIRVYCAHGSAADRT